MKCLNCGKEIIDENTKYCPNCGEKLAKERKCAVCNTIVNENDAYCKNCGASLENNDTYSYEYEEVKKEEKPKELEKTTKTFSIAGFVLSFIPFSIFITRILAIVFSGIALSRISKEKENNPNIDYKTFKTLSILGIIIPCVTFLGIIVFYIIIIIIFLSGGQLGSLLDRIPEYFL